jgi:hypothetical protein
MIFSQPGFLPMLVVKILNLRWILGSYSGGYDDCSLLGCNCVKSIESQLLFLRNILPPFLRSKNKLSEVPV